MSSRKKLSYESQVLLLKALEPLASNVPSYMNAFEAAGFKSFLAWVDFEEQFCKVNELQEHRRCLQERSIQKLTSPDGLLSRQFLEKEKINSDPCQIRRMKMEIENPAKVKSLRDKLHDDFIAYRLQEAHIYPDAPTTGCPNYLAFYRNILLDAFGPLGFELESDKLDSGIPAVRKSLTENWDLCWSSESDRTLKWWPPAKSKSVQKMSFLDLLCYLRRKGRFGRVNVPIGFKALDVVVLRIQHLLPGFAWAYSLFDGPEELRTVISAHAFMYMLVQEELELSLINGLHALNAA